MAQNNSCSDVYSSSSLLLDSSSSSLVDSLSLWDLTSFFMSVDSSFTTISKSTISWTCSLFTCPSFLSVIFQTFLYLTSFLFSVDFLHLVLLPSCDPWYLAFVHLFFLFSYPHFLTSDINVLFHGSIDHASTITSYVSIVMTFVTFNVTWGHICWRNFYFRHTGLVGVILVQWELTD